MRSKTLKVTNEFFHSRLSNLMPNQRTIENNLVLKLFLKQSMILHPSKFLWSRHGRGPRCPRGRSVWELSKGWSEKKLGTTHYKNVLAWKCPHFRIQLTGMCSWKPCWSPQPCLISAMLLGQPLPPLTSCSLWESCWGARGLSLQIFGRRSSTSDPLDNLTSVNVNVLGLDPLMYYYALITLFYKYLKLYLCFY